MKPICPACGYEVDRLIHVLGCKHASNQEVSDGASVESEMGEAGRSDSRHGADASPGAGPRVPRAPRVVA